MDFIVQKAINLGFDPVVAIQMATINVAQHFAMDDFIGGIAPGKYADVVIIPDLKTIRPEYVISSGKMVTKNGQLLIQPRKHKYSEAVQNSVQLPGDFKAADFAIRLDSNRRQAKVRVMDMVTDLIAREAIIDMPLSNGQIHQDKDKDILKVAAIDRTNMPGKTFVGLIRGIGLKRGAIALTLVWDSSDIIVVGATDTDMARAINRIKEMKGGMVVCADGQILAEIASPVGGWISTEPMETIAEKLYAIQQAAANLGFPFTDLRLTLSVLTTPAIPFLRITEHGLVDIRQNKLVDLIVD
jgi:adenine deaminase